MSLNSAIKRNVLASWGTHAVNLVMGFFLARYTLGVLGESTYGRWLLINSIASYSGLLYCGFGETISRFVAKYHSEDNHRRVNEIASVVMMVYLFMGGVALAAAGILAATAGWWGGWTAGDLTEVRIALVILGINVAIGLVGSVYGGVLHGLQRFDLERGIGTTFDLIRMGLFVLLLRQEHGLITIAGIYAVVAFGENFAYYLFAHRILPSLDVKRSLMRADVLKECGSFSSMSFLNTIASQFINATDTITIGLILGEKAIVPYYFGLRLAQFAKQPIDKISHIMMPTAGALQSTENRSRRDHLLVQALGLVMLLIGGAFIGAWHFAGDVLNLWIGSKLPADELTMSFRILLILLGAQLITLPCNVLRAFLFGSGHVKVPACIYLLEAVCNLSLSITLCLSFGIEGVAWGTVIPVVLIEFGVLVPYALRKLEVSPWRILRDAVMPQVVPLLTLLCFCQLVARQSWGHGDWRVLVAVTIAGASILGGVGWLRYRLVNRTELSAA